MLGVSSIYTFDISANPNALLATVHSSFSNPRAKALSEGFIASAAFLNQSADFLVGEGFASALRSASANLHGFAALGGGSLRHETGSHVDVDGYTLIAGLTAHPTLAAGDLTLGAFLEHGAGDYDTHNSFANAASVHGKGEAEYTVGGFLAQLDFPETQHGHFYVETSARAGKVKLDFRTRDLIDPFGRRAAYDSNSRYASAHIGVGYLWNIGERTTLKLYSQYLWSRQGSDTVRLTTGEFVKFAAVDSERTRLGVKWSQNVTQVAHFYLGAAWEHEYDGKARASIHGYRLATPGLTGDTGFAEAGFTLNPANTKPLTLEVGLQGYTGKREGVTGESAGKLLVLRHEAGDRSQETGNRRQKKHAALRAGKNLSPVFCSLSPVRIAPPKTPLDSPLSGGEGQWLFTSALWRNDETVVWLAHCPILRF
jgi:hypothetical protein